MTAHRNRVPPTTCCIKGCDQPRHVSDTGKVYTQCYPHMKETWNRNWKNTGKQRRTERGRSKPKPIPGRAASALDPVPDCVHVLAVDWKNNRLYRIEGRVVAVDAMPLTEGEWIDMQSKASLDGVLVAKPALFRKEEV